MKKTLTIGIMLAAIVAALLYFETTLGLTVARVTDGDTVVLSDGRKVRLLGIDTPELNDPARNRRNANRTETDFETVQAFAYKATVFVKGLIEGKEVRLEYDDVNIKIDHKDKYGRTLAYIYRVSDGMFVNAEIVKQGYGFAYTRFPFKYMEEFRGYEREARENERGLWK